MNKSKRIVVIVFVVIAVLIVVFGYLYLSGIYPGIHGYKVDVYFQEVSGLKTGSIVYIRGMEKGKVNEVEMTDDYQMVRVNITLDKSVNLTEDTRFAIRSLSYFGTDRTLTITPGTGPAAAKTTKFYGANEVLELESFFLKFSNLVTKLETFPFDVELKSIKKELFSKIDTFSKGFQIPLTEVAKQIELLVVKLDTLADFIKSDGTVKKLVTSEELYQEVRDTNQKLRELLEDIKTNPKKYFQIKVF